MKPAENVAVTKRSLVNSVLICYACLYHLSGFERISQTGPIQLDSNNQNNGSLDDFE